MLIIFSLFTVAFSSASDCGYALKTSGAVHVQTGSTAKPLQVNKPIACLATLITGANGKALLKLPGAKVSVAPSTRFKVREHVTRKRSKTSLDLIYGKIRALFQPESTQQRELSVKTPTAVAGVRGTDFVIAFKPETRVTEHLTLKGEVVLTLLANGQRIVARKGQTITMLEPPPTNLMVASTPSDDQSESQVDKKSYIEVDQASSAAQKKALENLSMD